MSDCDDIQRILIRLPASVQVTVRERIGIPGPPGPAGGGTGSGSSTEIRVANRLLQIKHTDEPTWVTLYDFSKPIRGGKFGP